MNRISDDEASFVLTKINSVRFIESLSYSELEDLLHLCGPTPRGRNNTTLHRARLMRFAQEVLHARL
jgi:hypothetical protein